MNAPHDPLEAARLLAEPEELMKFTLIYDGDLPAGDKKRNVAAGRIRNELHDQLADLWDTHGLLRELRRHSQVPEGQLNVLGQTNVLRWGQHGKIVLREFKFPPTPPPPGYVDLCGPMPVERSGSYIPLVRNSLYLKCSIDILFLRHEEPLHLFQQGGDLDNRLKTFFDALRMPSVQEAEQAEGPCADPLYCLLEDDRLITDFSVKSGRLLGRSEKRRHAVRLTADVTVKVMRLSDQNESLLAG